MGIDLAFLFAIALSYLGLLFVIAWCTERGWLPDRLVRSPLVYSLSLGVYATSWTYYGSVGLADRSGFAFLNIYLGLTGAFILGPYLLRPILRLCREHQLTSIADLLAFRYGGRATGFAVTLFMLIGILPYISLQIRAVTESIQILSQQAPPNLLALVFCAVITIFAILFGARHLTPREKHRGLVVAIAFESAIKLIAMVIAGLFAVTQVFDSPMAMSQWASKQPEMLNALYSPATTGLWPTLLLLSFCAAFTLPRQYHMTFAENETPRHLNTAYWLFPLYLLILNLPIIPILFAGRFLSLPMESDFYVLGMTLTLGREWLAILVFLGGLSAASAMMIVTTLALSSMCMNHFLLPATLATNRPRDFYRRLLWGRRMIITAIIGAGYGFYIIIELQDGLASLGLISFVAAAQLLPGVFGVLFWPRATQAGFITGLTAGSCVWFLLLILPLIDSRIVPTEWVAPGIDIWTLTTFCTLSINAFLFIVGSLLSQPTDEELAAAQAANEHSALTASGATIAQSVVHYRYALRQALGGRVARDEIDRALQETGIRKDETRRSELRVLHDRLERNLTGLLGPTLAREILRRQPGSHEGLLSNTLDARMLERRLQSSREQMRGLTKQIDDLRQYLQDVLRQLPLGVCSISANGQIYIWNSAMHKLTGIDERDAYDKPLDQLQAPWGLLLSNFALSSDKHQIRRKAFPGDRPVTINLHKADIGADIGMPIGQADALVGQVILMEDRTELDTLEAELAHSERLASIGRLAAGVAHEIGNPLTGIASIAQNLHYEVSDNESAPVIREQTDDILTQVGRINSIVRSLLTFSHADAVTDTPYEVVDVTQRVNEAVRLIKLSPDLRRLSIQTSMPESVLVYGDANLLMQVFVNLVNNACDASPDGATIHVQGFIHDNELTVETIDEGSGVSPEAREQMFEPFFTTKAVGQGTGLGLSLAYSIVANHKGRLRIGDSEQGTRMIVTLPLYNAAS
ncbi:sensor histidine kinase [Granulosicoccus antarcticus]|uniref:histidine kinase n=1 Tax=Granulosicoccus antarcticus IMCC3135 TaxID=1192854 RepID=A0A2Z2NUR0_9GAMM|nr:sensor histidine kinase [Granulosicoccus antarcticus]ASJ75302.1 Sporulation kinase A [Granulosicoccus antarcticus IMCC3135]